MNPENSAIKIFTGSASRNLSEQIATELKIPLGKTEFRKFSDGEFETSFEESVRGSYVFIIQSTFQPTDNLMELLLMIDAAKRASAYKIIAVIPYFGFARQDRKDKPRCSIGSKLVANMLTVAGISRMMTMDLHTDQIQGFFDVPVDHLYGSSIFVKYIRNLNIDNLVLAAPDMGGTKRVQAYARHLLTELVICHKYRKVENKVDSITLIGNVKDKNVIILDDMIDTGETLCVASKVMMDMGAKSVRAIATHAVLSGNAIEKINESSLLELVVTDTIPLKQQSPKIKVLSVADIFAKVIKSVYESTSISQNFIM